MQRRFIEKVVATAGVLLLAGTLGTGCALFGEDDEANAGGSTTGGDSDTGGDSETGDSTTGGGTTGGGTSDSGGSTTGGDSDTGGDTGGGTGGTGGDGDPNEDGWEIIDVGTDEERVLVLRVLQDHVREVGLTRR